MKTCVLAGSFDPIHNGHLWLAERGAKMFGSVTVAICVNPKKTPTFDASTRMKLVMTSLAQAGIDAKVRMIPNGLTVDAVNKINDYATTEYYLLRGIRSASDLEYEATLSNVNSVLSGNAQTVFLMPPRELQDVSSSVVRELMLFSNKSAIKRYVPQCVFNKIMEDALVDKVRNNPIFCRHISGDKTAFCMRLLQSYTGRAYHNAEHIHNCLVLLEDFCTDGGDGRAGALELFTALLFHDIDKDIEKSVQIMMESFGATEKSLSVGQSWLADAAKYIRATNYSLEICDTTGGAIVADIDLSILGQEPWLYDVYAKNIREEYKKRHSLFCFRQETC